MKTICLIRRIAMLLALLAPLLPSATGRAAQAVRAFVSNFGSGTVSVVDPQTGQPHIHQHNVTEREVEEVLSRPGEDRPGREGTRVAIGQTRGGRYLRVIYVPGPERAAVFVITAYDLRGKPLAAYRRRRQQRRS